VPPSVPFARKFLRSSASVRLSDQSDPTRRDRRSARPKNIWLWAHHRVAILPEKDLRQPEEDCRDQCGANRSDARHGRCPSRTIRRKVTLIRPFSNNPAAFSSVEVPSRIRSTPWKISREEPPNQTRSPLCSANLFTGSLRDRPPTANVASSPSEIETTGPSKLESPRSWCKPRCASPS